MKKLFFILLLSIGIGNTYAQQYFNNRYTLNSNYSYLNTVFSNQNKYYCFGFSHDSLINSTISNSNNWVWNLKFSEFDTNGNILLDTIYYNKFYTKIIGNAFLQSLRKAIILNDGSYLILLNTQDSNLNNISLFLKFNNKGQKIYESYLNIDPLQRYGSYSVDFQIDPNKNVLVLSAVIPDTSLHGKPYDFYLTKMDSNFNLIWQQNYGYWLWQDYPAKLCVDSFGYTMGGSTTNSNVNSPNQSSYTAEIFRTDTAGNQQWVWLSNPDSNKLFHTMYDMVQTKDGGYLFAGDGDGHMTFNGNSYNLTTQAVVKKLDKNRQIVWEQTYPFTYTKKEFNPWDQLYYYTLYCQGSSNIIRLINDSTAVVAGDTKAFQASDTGNKFKAGAGLVKFNTHTGAPIWKRIYNRTLIDSANCKVLDMKPTPDGGFVLCGEADKNTYPIIKPYQQAWLLKVDSNGCTSTTDPNCWTTGVENLPTAIASFSLYPNPINDAFKVVNTEEGVLYLYNLQGQNISSYALSIGSHDLTMPTPAASGIYMGKWITKKTQQTQIIKIIYQP